MIPLQMELGGKDACIVLEDADLELAATNIIKGGYSYRYIERNICSRHVNCHLQKAFYVK